MNTTTSRYVPSFDGLRAMAVFGVLAYHANVPGASLGWIGVDLFFVLSGFLITTLLIDENARNGQIRLAQFWGRRFLRLMPAYWLYIGAMTLAMWTNASRPVDHGSWTPNLYIASLWGYFVNYAPQGGIWKHQYLLQHLWSLAVEEQFYLLWPLVVVVGLKIRHLDFILLCLLASALTSRFFVSDSELIKLLHTRGVGIIVGCGAALWLRRHESRPWFQKQSQNRMLTITVVSTMATLLVLTIAYEQRSITELQIHRFILPIITLQFGFLAILLWQLRCNTISRLLGARLMAHIGRLSYGIYLYHMIAHMLTWRVLLDDIEHWPREPKFLLRFIVFCTLSYGLAAISYKVYETPFLRLKDRLRATGMLKHK